jgi:hypothetical protein
MVLSNQSVDFIELHNCQKSAASEEAYGRVQQYDGRKDSVYQDSGGQK